MGINFSGVVVIKTRSGSVYHFGPADPNGERDIRAENGFLNFSRGKIVGSGAPHKIFTILEHTEPVVGEQMAIEPTNSSAPKEDFWYTTEIVSIEQG